MIPAGFDYLRARTLDEAMRALAGDEDAKLLAGGHSLLPLMKLRLSFPSVLVDISGIEELSYVREEGAELLVGALTTHHMASRDPLVRRFAPAFSAVAAQIGDPQVRHRGTVGGSLAHGDPASDLPAVLLAAGGTLVVEGPSGRRLVPAGEFHKGFLATALEPGEILVELRMEKTEEPYGFEKLTKRAQDWAIVGAVAVRREGAIGVGLVNMGSVPLRASAVEEALSSGSPPAEAAELAPEGTAPPSDLNGSSEYRQHLAKVLVRRAVEKAAA